MIKASDLLNDFHRMLSEHWTYGTDTREGNVDCSGAFVWSFKQHGSAIYHGSNYIARREIVKMLPMSKAKAGMAAFKKRAIGDKYYALPSKYQLGGVYYNGDLNDYYHIGLVDTDGNILNAQSTKTGFVKSKPDGWCGCAYLKRVNYADVVQETVTEAKQDEEYNAFVIGGALNVRRSASKIAYRLAQLPEGSKVTVLSTSGEWSKIIFNDVRTGFVMTKFLKKVEE